MARPKPIEDPLLLKDFFEQLKQSPVQRGPKVIESKSNSNTLLKEKEWKHIIEKENKSNISHSILYNSLRLGLDKQGLTNMRPQIWGFLIDISKMSQQYVSEDDQPLEKYTTLAAWRLQYGETDVLKKQIEVDLPRTSGLRHFVTVHGHPVFPPDDGRPSLHTEDQAELLASMRNVLTAVANALPTVGYVQGMNHMVGALMYHLQDYHFRNTTDALPALAVHKELFVFWIMMHILQELNWKLVFTKEFPKLVKLSQAFEQKLVDHNKDLIDHIYYYAIHEGLQAADKKAGLVDIFMSHFFTAFTDVVPPNLSGTLLDLFLLSGEKVILDVLQRALVFNKETIMASREKEVGQYKLGIAQFTQEKDGCWTVRG